MGEQKDLVGTISKLAIEYWKLLRSYDRTITTLPPDNRLLSVARNAERKLQSILQEAELSLIAYEGQEYSPNLAVTVINSDEFESSDVLRISQTVEPTVVQRGAVISIGKALVERV